MVTKCNLLYLICLRETSQNRHLWFMLTTTPRILSCLDLQKFLFINWDMYYTHACLANRTTTGKLVWELDQKLYHGHMSISKTNSIVPTYANVYRGFAGGVPESCVCTQKRIIYGIFHVTSG